MPRLASLWADDLLFCSWHLAATSRLVFILPALVEEGNRRERDHAVGGAGAEVGDGFSASPVEHGDAGNLDKALDPGIGECWTDLKLAEERNKAAVQGGASFILRPKFDVECRRPSPEVFRMAGDINGSLEIEDGVRCWAWMCFEPDALHAVAEEFEWRIPKRL